MGRLLRLSRRVGPDRGPCVGHLKVTGSTKSLPGVSRGGGQRWGSAGAAGWNQAEPGLPGQAGAARSTSERRLVWVTCLPLVGRQGLGAALGHGGGSGGDGETVGLGPHWLVLWLGTDSSAFPAAVLKIGTNPFLRGPEGPPQSLAVQLAPCSTDAAGVRARERTDVPLYKA